MIMRTLTSDPAVALELGRRLAVNAQRQQREATKASSVWSRWFARTPTKVTHRHN